MSKQFCFSLRGEAFGCFSVSFFSFSETQWVLVKTEPVMIGAAVAVAPALGAPMRKSLKQQQKLITALSAIGNFK